MTITRHRERPFILWVLTSILALIFFALSALHFYWASGKPWGMASSIPTTTTGKPLFTPGPGACALVGMGLLGLGSFYVLWSGLVPVILPGWIFTVGGIVVPSIFALRAVGEFRYVGFFKQIKGTRFATMDTRVYSPLCLTIAAMGFAVRFASLKG